MISLLYLSMSSILLKMSFIHVMFLEHILSINKSLRCIQGFQGCIYIFFFHEWTCSYFHRNKVSGFYYNLKQVCVLQS